MSGPRCALRAKRLRPWRKVADSLPGSRCVSASEGSARLGPPGRALSGRSRGSPERCARLLLAGCLLALCACNAALGGAAVAVVGTAAYFAAECYDHLSVVVRDARTGGVTCDAEVWASDGDSERRLRPCYHASLSPGRWTVELRNPGFEASRSELVVAERDAGCPHATRSVELTLRPRSAAPAQTPSPAAAARL